MSDLRITERQDERTRQRPKLGLKYGASKPVLPPAQGEAAA